MRWTANCTVAAALCLTAWFFIADLRHPWANTFRVFYYAAKAVRDGASIYASHAPGSKSGYVYPPLFAFLCLPFLSLKLSCAIRVWLGIDVALTWFALLLGAREILRRFLLTVSWRACLTLASGAFLLSVGEIRTEWSTGQTDTLVVMAFVLALCWLDRVPWLAALALGLGANFKYQPLLVLAWLAVRRRWRLAGFTVLAAVGCAMLPALASGWMGNLGDLKIAFAGLASFAGVHSDVAAPTESLTWIRSVSVTSAIGRLLESLHLDPGGALVFAGAVALLFLGLISWIYRKHSRRLSAITPGSSLNPASGGVIACEWVGLMVAWLAFGPEVSRRHMFVLVLLHLVALGLLSSTAAGMHRKLLVAGLLVWQIGMRVPLGHSLWFQNAANAWTAMGGPSWCLLCFYSILLWTGLEWARNTQMQHIHITQRRGLVRAVRNVAAPGSRVWIDAAPKR
jgi:hypothetical protein